MPARSVCLVTLSLSEAGPGRFGRQVSVTDIYHTIPYRVWYGMVCEFYRNDHPAMRQYNLQHKCIAIAKTITHCSLGE